MGIIDDVLIIKFMIIGLYFHKQYITVYNCYQVLYSVCS